MKRVLRGVAFVVTLTVMLLFGVATAESASAAPKTGSVTTSITNQLQAVSPGSTGSVTVTRFTNRGGTLIASGTATVTNAQGTATQAFAVPVADAASAAPVAAAAASCQILNLVLGPLHLDLLGLVVDLNQVVLTITAVPGAGNLLGNLLCAVAGLLDGPAPLGTLAGLLNQILGILG